MAWPSMPVSAHPACGVGVDIRIDLIEDVTVIAAAVCGHRDELAQLELDQGIAAEEGADGAVGKEDCKAGTEPVGKRSPRGER